MLGAEHAAPVINARSELPLSLSSDTTVPQGTADVNTQGSTEYTPLRTPTLDAEGAANEVEMPVISENAPADRKAAQFDIIRQSNPFDAELGNHTWIKFQSTPPARGATIQKSTVYVLLDISIHAPREGGDLDKLAAHYGVARISIHAPREGGDTRSGDIYPNIYISIHAPREGGRRCGLNSDAIRRYISIHAPREGGDEQRCTVLPVDL